VSRVLTKKRNTGIQYAMYTRACRRHLRWVMCCFVSCGWFLPLLADDLPFGSPDAGRPAADPVGFEESRRIALRHAEDLWGVVSPGPVIPCTDLDGCLLARQFIFRRSGEGWTSSVAVLSRVRAGVQEYRRASAPEHDTAPSTVTYRDSEQIRRMRWGIGEFGTIVVSATRDRVPVPERIHGLPPYFTRMDEVLDYLHAAHGIVGAQLRRVIYLSPVEQWLEFEYRGDSVFVDCQAIRRVDAGRVAAFRSRGTGRPDATARQRLNALWRDALDGR
jgi:hypothetical protein